MAGALSLNAALLGLSRVYGLLQWRATGCRPDPQNICATKCWSRGSAKPASFARLLVETDRLLRERLLKNPDIKADLAEARNQILEQVQSRSANRPAGIPACLAN